MKDKALLQSKTIRGILISCLPVLAFLGVEISQDDVSLIFDNLGALIVAFCNIAGAGLAIYGRIKADTKIKL